MKSESRHPLLRQLSICGQVAEHKSKKVREHGGDEAAILSALNADQQARRRTFSPMRWNTGALS